VTGELRRWEQWNPRRQHQPKRVVTPKLGISVVGLILNRLAVEMIGRDKRAVILYWDEESKSIGLWFFKNEVNAPEGAKVYSVTYYVEGVARMSPPAFMQAHDLLARAKETGKKQFLLKKEERDALGANFYSAQIA
jgi:hypothetical protein